MQPKIFEAKNGMKITLRRIKRADIRRAKEFMEFINEIIDENDYIHYNKRFSLKEERVWVKETLKGNKKRESATLLAEHEGKIVGSSGIISKNGRENHVAVLGITIRRDYRGLGIGAQMILTAINEAKKSLKTKPKIIELDVFETNKNAQTLYQKLGFKEIARLPNRIQRREQMISKIIMEKYV